MATAAAAASLALTTCYDDAHASDRAIFNTRLANGIITGVLLHAKKEK